MIDMPIPRALVPGRRTALSGVLLALAVSMATACEDPNRPQAVMEVRIAPDSAHLAPGESVEFDPIPRDDSGNPLPDRRPDAEWSMRPSSLAELSSVDETGRVRVTGLATGTGNLEATFNRRSGSVPVYIHPPGLDRVEIEPNPVLVSPGVPGRPRAVLLDADGQELNTDGFRMSWQVPDTSVASIPIVSRGLSNPIPVSIVQARVSSGETFVRLIVNGRVVTAPVIITPQPLIPAEDG